MLVPCQSKTKCIDKNPTVGDVDLAIYIGERTPP